MLKYILLLCLILQLGACRDVRSGGGSEEVKKGVETVETKTVEVGDTENVKEGEGHVVKKDHPVEIKLIGKNEEETRTNDASEPVKHPNVEKPVIETKTLEQPKGYTKEETDNEEVTDSDRVSNTNVSISEDADSGNLRQGGIGGGNICIVNDQRGVCVPSSIQCLSSKGSLLGTLGANGQCSPFSVCCRVTRTCGQSSSKKSIYFTSPTVFDATTTTCDFTINVKDPKVCQVRLDFESFSIAPARATNNNGFTCQEDSFTIISPSNEKLPVLCGFNTGQHLYVRINVTNNERSIRLRFSLAGRPGMVGGVTLTNPQWEIRATQLECAPGRNARDLRLEPIAPPGCLQYFPERTGVVNSFGYNPNSAVTGSNYLANLDYSICFRRTPTTCGMKFTPVSFSMSGMEHNCMGDYVFIPESIIYKTDGTTTQIGLGRVCGRGGAIPAGAYVQAKGSFPTFVHFKSDNANGNNENGFSIKYEVPPTNNCV